MLEVCGDELSLSYKLVVLVLARALARFHRFKKPPTPAGSLPFHTNLFLVGNVSQSAQHQVSPN